MKVGALICWVGVFPKGEPRSKWVGVVKEKHPHRDWWKVHFPTSTQWVAQSEMVILCK